jgi:sugar phosphate isomerase/epimerase
MNFYDRIGFDAGGRPLEEALAWAISHGFHYVDFNADRLPNRLDSWDEARVRAVRAQCERHDIQLGLHTLSDVKEVHLKPGEGNIDFTTLLQRLESSGYQQHYMMAFGTQADLLAGRDYFVACVPTA